jgi:hypothetical protein
LTAPFNVVTNLDGISDLDSVEDQILLGHSIFSAAGPIGRKLTPPAPHTGSARSGTQSRRHRQSALEKQLLNVAVAQGIAQIPADRLQDQRGLEVPALGASGKLARSNR